jgi:hypothetical protein
MLDPRMVASKIQTPELRVMALILSFDYNAFLWE